MAKIFTEVQLDRTRYMRFGYKIIKQIDKMAEKFKTMSELEILETLIFLGLKEDDNDLKLEQIEDLLDEYGVEFLSKALDETLDRDMPGLKKKAGLEEKSSSSSEVGIESPNE